LYVDVCLGDTDLERATGAQEKDAEQGLRLNRVYQLTGFSDPIYAEAFVNVHQYDVVLGMSKILMCWLVADIV
jgi:coatomer subunit beta